MLSTCTNLQSLFLDCSLYYNADPKCLARQIFRDGHHYLEAVGSARGQYDAAIEIIELSERNFDMKRSSCSRELEKRLTKSERDSANTNNIEKFKARLRELLKQKY